MTSVVRATIVLHTSIATAQVPRLHARFSPWQS